jgi:hypothetical protein
MISSQSRCTLQVLIDKNCFSKLQKELLSVAFLEQEKLVVSIPGFSFPSGLDLENTNFFRKLSLFLNKKTMLSYFVLYVIFNDFYFKIYVNCTLKLSYSQNGIT